MSSAKIGRQAVGILCRAHARYICTSVSDCIRHISYICLAYADTWISESPSAGYGTNHCTGMCSAYTGTREIETYFVEYVYMLSYRIRISGMYFIKYVRMVSHRMRISRAYFIKYVYMVSHRVWIFGVYFIKYVYMVSHRVRISGAHFMVYVRVHRFRYVCRNANSASISSSVPMVMRR